MAIVKMKRLSLAVLRSRKDALLDELIKHGCVEFSEIESEVAESEVSGVLTRESSNGAKLRSDLQILSNALDILNRSVPAKEGLLTAKPEVESDSILSNEGVDGALNIAGRIVSSDDEIKRISTEESRQRSILESLTPWLDFSLPLQTTGTERASLILGSIPAAVKLNEVENAIGEVSDEAELFRISSDKAANYVAVVAIKEAVAGVLEALRPYSFTQISFSGMEGTAQKCSYDVTEELKDLAGRKESAAVRIKEEAPRRDYIRLAHDKLLAQISKSEAEDRLYGTDSIVYMQGWIPEEKEKEIFPVFDAYDCAFETREPEEDEYPSVPVKLKNNKVTDSLNMVTNMYSLPLYGTVDPNPLMAPFFILFYGLMMADIGYGLIMIIAAIVAMKKIKPREGTLSFCRLLLWCGVATLVCGALTGGFFSDIPYQLVHLINPESTWQGLPALFSPTRDSNMVLYGSMVLGALQLNTGMAVSFVRKCKTGHVADAIWYEGTLWLILITGIMAILKIGNVNGIPVALIVAVVLMLAGQARGKKGIGILTSAFAAIYNEATGWFGDVLSYARIMALMLAGGVVGQVFNTVAIMPAKSSGINVGTVIAFVLIFLFGHAMNFALNILGCYVHDLRLQCLEYFKKFYEAGGKPFRPLKINGKYYNVEE